MSRSVGVVILAAGSGSRLMPVTADRPKCMVSLAGRPLIERQLNVLAAHDIGDITVVGGYKAECLKSLGVSLILNPDYQTTNMVWTMMCARALFDGKRDIVMAYGDIVYEPRVLQAILQAKGPMVVAADRRWLDLWALRMESPLDDAETFSVKSDGTLAELGQKPSSLDQIEGQYLGLVRFDKEIHGDLLMLYDRLQATLGHDDPAFRNLYMTDFLQAMIDAGWTVRIAWTENGWLEVDTTQDLEVYENLHQTGGLASICRLD
jgi:choline kinase